MQHQFIIPDPTGSDLCRETIECLDGFRRAAAGSCRFATDACGLACMSDEMAGCRRFGNAIAVSNSLAIQMMLDPIEPKARTRD
jgi:hypothetical protein